MCGGPVVSWQDGRKTVATGSGFDSVVLKTKRANYGLALW
jgi:hypothetical protein